MINSKINRIISILFRLVVVIGIIGYWPLDEVNAELKELPQDEENALTYTGLKISSFETIFVDVFSSLEKSYSLTGSFNPTEKIDYIFPWPVGQKMSWGSRTTEPVWHGIHDYIIGTQTIKYTAIDFITTSKQDIPIHVAAGGTAKIVCVGDKTNDFNVNITDANGTMVRYFHLDKTKLTNSPFTEVKLNQTATVQQGQLLGYTIKGNLDSKCGRAFQTSDTGHVHFVFPKDTGIELNGYKFKYPDLCAKKEGYPDICVTETQDKEIENVLPCPVSSQNSVLLYKNPNYDCANLPRGQGWEEIPIPTGSLNVNMPIGSIRFPNACPSSIATSVEANTQYQIKNSSGDLFLDVNNNSNEDGMSIIQWQSHGGSNQRWLFEPIPNEPNYYNLKALNSEKCLSVNKNDWRAIQYQCSKELEGQGIYQKWKITYKNGGFIIQEASTNWALKSFEPNTWGYQPLIAPFQDWNIEYWKIYRIDTALKLKNQNSQEVTLFGNEPDLKTKYSWFLTPGSIFGQITQFQNVCPTSMPLSDANSPTTINCGGISNSPPNTPKLTSPSSGSGSLNTAPSLCWQSQGDPDNNSLEYKVEIFDSPINLSSAWMKNTCWRPASLDGQFHTYQWRVKARDPLLAESGWSQTRTFTVQSPNRPPTISFSTANGDPFSSGIVYSRDTNWTFAGTASDYEGDLNRIEWRCRGDNCGTASAHNGTNSWNHTQNGLSGRNDIYFVAYDSYGNNTPSRHLDLRIDLVSPVTTIGLNSESEPGKWPTWFTGPVTVSLKGMDQGTGQAISGVNQLLYRIDGGTWQTVSGASVNFIVSSDGSHTIDYYAVDAVGNTETAHSAVFQIDQTPPGNPDNVTDNNGAIDDVWQNARNIPQLKWNEAADATSGLWGYQLYFGEDATGTGLINFPANAAREWTPQPGGVHTGTYYLRGRTRDNAGNWSAWTTWFTYRYDGTPPENPTQVTHAAGITNTLWQNATNSANFSWPVPNDEGSGLLGYYVAWSTNPTATGTLLLTNNTYLDLTPLCGENEACIGYLRLRSVDNVGNLANDWNTVFEMRYDNAPPVLDFAFENGATQTHQTLITINLDADDQGSGVRSMRLSNDNRHWTDWEAYRTTRPGWPIAAISRQTWPVYVQVQDWVGLSSEIEVRSIYLDVNQAQPQSANFRLFDTGMNMGVGTYTSSIYSGRGTTGQMTDAGLITSSHFQIWNGFEAGSQAVPIAQPGHDDFNHINGVFATGHTVTGMVSASYQLLGVFGETGLPNLTSIVSSHFQHQPGFLAAQPSPLAPVTPPAPGPVPDPLPVITCKSPSVTINAKAEFTNTLNVSLALCGPQVAEMKISNDPAFAGADWQPFSDTVSWTLRDEGAQVSPRFVYVMFKDTTGIVHGAYFDDVIYDPNVPDSEVLFSDDVAESGAMTTIRVAKGFTPGGEADTRIAYEEIPVIAAQPDGSVKLFIKGYDDNSGIAEVQISEDPTFTGAEWIPFSMVQFWTPESPDDGRKVAYIRTRDQAGNIAAVNQVDFVFDANGPYGWPSFDQHILSTQAISVTVYMGAFDGTMNEDYGEENPPANFYEGVVEDMRISNDPLFMDTAWQPYADTYELPVSVSDVSRTIYVQYRDYAGNVSEIHSNSYEFDAIGPTVQVDASYGATLTRTLSIYAYDDLSGLSEIRLSSDPLMAEDNTVTLPFSETIDWQFDENRIVWIQVSDEVGNWSEIYPVYAYEIEAAIHDVFLPMILSVAQAVTP